MVNHIANIILYDKDNRFLLQHRDEDADDNPDRWGFFGGHKENNETPLDTLRREACEELGYAVRDPKLLTERQSNISGQEGSAYIYYEECHDKSSLRRG